jgi:MoaA/NifB/PqqE/SkfB family radical SAM enzyme
MKLFKKYSVKAVEIAITYNCNQHCQHCSASFFTKKLPFTKEKIKDIIKQCADIGTIYVCLTGGEPTLDKNLEEYISEIKRYNMFPIIITNGTILDKKGILKLKKAGLMGFYVSINGSGKSHESFANRNGNYSKAIENLLYAKKIGLFARIATVPLHETLKNKEFDNIINFARDNDITIKINYPIPTGSYSKKKSVMLNEEERKIVKKYEKLPFVSTDLLNGIHENSCPGINSSLYITYYGDILPCPFIPISFGNLWNTELKEFSPILNNKNYFNKEHRMCVAGESKEFIENYMNPVYENKETPVTIKEHPKFKNNLGKQEIVRAKSKVNPKKG